MRGGRGLESVRVLDWRGQVECEVKTTSWLAEGK